MKKYSDRFIKVMVTTISNHDQLEKLKKLYNGEKQWNL